MAPRSGNSSFRPSRLDGSGSVLDLALLSYDLAPSCSLRVLRPCASTLDHVPFLYSLSPLFSCSSSCPPSFSRPPLSVSVPRGPFLPLCVIPWPCSPPELIYVPWSRVLISTLRCATRLACPQSLRVGPVTRPWWSPACTRAHSRFLRLARFHPLSHATALARSVYRRLCSFRRSGVCYTLCRPHLVSSPPSVRSFSGVSVSHLGLPCRSPSHRLVVFTLSCFSPFFPLPAGPPTPLSWSPGPPSASLPIRVPALQAALGRLRRGRVLAVMASVLSICWTLLSSLSSSHSSLSTCPLLLFLLSVWKVRSALSIRGRPDPPI